VAADAHGGDGAANLVGVALARVRAVTLWSTLIVLILVALVAVGVRIATDWPNVTAGTVPPEDSFHRRYALHPALAYAHILPGVVYLLGAPFQLSRRFRERRIAMHRRMGRVVLPAGVMAGVFAIVFGTLFAFGGLFEASATVVFGAYFVTALVIAFIAIRGGDVTRHRRWMIRAIAIGLAIGTIRIWIGVFQGLGVLSFEDSFGVAFWLSFVLHALAAELYLARRPGVQSRAVALRS
jgi:cytochrome bd-type quinol oxidase subunit 1